MRTQSEGIERCCADLAERAKDMRSQVKSDDRKLNVRIIYIWVLNRINVCTYSYMNVQMMLKQILSY